MPLCAIITLECILFAGFISLCVVVANLGRLPPFPLRGRHKCGPYGGGLIVLAREEHFAICIRKGRGQDSFCLYQEVMYDR